MTKYNIVVTEEQRVALRTLLYTACANSEGEANANMGKLFNLVVNASEQVLDIEALTAFTEKDAVALAGHTAAAKMRFRACNKPYEAPSDMNLMIIFQQQRSDQLGAVIKAITPAWIIEARKITG